MQSLPTKPVTRQKPAGYFFLSGKFIPVRLCYQGLHLAAWAAESDKYTYLTSGVDVSTAALVTRLELCDDTRRCVIQFCPPEKHAHL